MQSGVTVGDDSITGTLKFIEGGLAESGPLAGDGYFLALKFQANWARYTSVKVGLNPSASGMELVDLLPDPDKNGVFKITNKATQKFKIVSTDGIQTITKEYNLSGLTLENVGA